jgi:hypothetical protein
MKRIISMLLIILIVSYLGGHVVLAESIQVILNVYRGKCTNIYGTNDGEGTVKFEIELNNIADNDIDVNLKLYENDSSERSINSCLLDDDISETLIYESEELPLPYYDNYSIKAETIIDGSAGPEVIEYFDIRPVLQIPQNINITYLKTINDNIELEWSSVNNATNYKLYFIKNYSDFENGIYIDETNGSTSLSTDISEFNNEFEYFYIVAYNGAKRIGRSQKYLINHKIITGTISLPNGESTMGEDIPIYVYAWTDNGTPNIWEDDYYSNTQIVIPKGEISAGYSLSVLTNTSENSGYYIRYCIAKNIDNYIQYGYYSSVITVPGRDAATLIDVSRDSKSNINLEILKLEDIDDDYSNDFNAAAPVYSNITMHGNIDYSGDIDCFIFTPAHSGEYIIKTTGSIDTYGYIFDSNKNEIKKDDDSGSGFNFLISYNMQAGEVYYIKVRQYNSGTGEYNLYVINNQEFNVITGSFIFKDSNGHPISNLYETQEIELSAELTNNDIEEINGILIIGLYSGSTLIKVIDTVDIELPGESSDIFSTDFILPECSENNYLKLFIWASIHELRSLSTPTSFPEK